MAWRNQGSSSNHCWRAYSALHSGSQATSERYEARVASSRRKLMNTAESAARLLTTAWNRSSTSSIEEAVLTSSIPSSARARKASVSTSAPRPGGSPFAVDEDIAFTAQPVIQHRFVEPHGVGLAPACESLAAGEQQGLNQTRAERPALGALDGQA